MKPKKLKVKAWAVVNPNWKKDEWPDPFWEPFLAERNKTISAMSIFLSKEDAKEWKSKSGKIIPVTIEEVRK